MRLTSGDLDPAFAELYISTVKNPSMSDFVRLYRTIAIQKVAMRVANCAEFTPFLDAGIPTTRRSGTHCCETGLVSG